MGNWHVESADNWDEYGTVTPGLSIHDTGNFIAIPASELEDFLVDLGEVVYKLAGADVKDYIKLLIRLWRERVPAEVLDGEDG